MHTNVAILIEYKIEKVAENISLSSKNSYSPYVPVTTSN